MGDEGEGGVSHFREATLRWSGVGLRQHIPGILQNRGKVEHPTLAGTVSSTLKPPPRLQHPGRTTKLSAEIGRYDKGDHRFIFQPRSAP